MNTVYNSSVKVGDTIVVVTRCLGDWFDKEFIVCKLLETMPGWILVATDGITDLSALCPSDYKIIKHSSPPPSSHSPLSSCKYCKGTGKIRLLTSTVDCECV